MAMLLVLLGIGQKCSGCGQRSSPKLGRGNWEVMGVWNGSVYLCTKCGSLVRVGFFSDELLSEEDSERFLAAREEHLR